MQTAMQWNDCILNDFKDGAVFLCLTYFATHALYILGKAVLIRHSH